MVKKTNCLLCQNLEASEAALRRLWRLAKFLQSSKFYLTFAFTFETGVALILRYLLTDLLLIQTKLCDPSQRPSRHQNIIILIFFFSWTWIDLIQDVVKVQRGGHGDLRCCGVDVFFKAVMRRIKSQLAVLWWSQTLRYAMFVFFYAAVFGEMKLFAVLGFFGLPFSNLNLT